MKGIEYKTSPPTWHEYFQLFSSTGWISVLNHILGYQEFRREPLGSKVKLVYLEKIVIEKKKNVGYKNS